MHTDALIYRSHNIYKKNYINGELGIFAIFIIRIFFFYKVRVPTEGRNRKRSEGGSQPLKPNYGTNSS